MSDKPTIARAWGDFCQSREACRVQSTRLAKEFHFNVFARSINTGRPIDTVSVEDIAKFASRMIKEQKLCTTIRSYFSTLKPFFNWAVRQGLMAENPVQPGRLPALPTVVKPRRLAFSMDELLRLEAQIRREDGGTLNADESHDWIAACQIGYWSGMRFSDIATLEWEEPPGRLGSWVDMIEEVIIAHPRKKRARRERLEIPIQPELYDVLQRLNASRHLDRPYVLPMMAFNYLNSRAMLAMQFRRLCNRAGLPGHSFHSFRHGFVSRLVNGGVDPIIIGSITGQSPAQIKSYAHVNTAARREALESIREPLNT